MVQNRVCECIKFFCLKSVNIPPEVAEEIDKNGYMLIVDGCTTPIPEGVKLLRKEEGYKIYEIID